MDAWIRTIAVGCVCLLPLGCEKSNEVVVEQRHAATLPGLDGTVKVRIGDVRSGREADVEIVGADSASLGSKTNAKVGDRIPFSHGGRQYEVEVVKYVDELVGNDDTATFRLIHRQGK